MTNQRLRTLTTGRLHTTIEDFYEDVEYITGEKGMMTHMIPNVLRAMQDWLREKVTDARFWDDAYDTTHTGETDLQPMTGDERDAFFKRYSALPHPFPAMVARSSTSATQTEEIVNCSHCWHTTNNILPSDPPLVEEFCCWCNKRRYLRIKVPVLAGEHGPFLQKSPFNKDIQPTVSIAVK